ncbi:MAG: ABC transporter ATP-binding protein [Rhodospirillaceae bacterium]|nr:ABC transporter ATP-binding protein [Rhodospirillaceae bacterium]
MTNQTTQSGLRLKGITRLGLGPIDLNLASGQITALMGPSGAGKTMLLRAIADLDPAQGNAFINGQDRNEIAPTRWRKRVVYVPAITGWWDEKIRPHFVGADKNTTKQILHALGLESTALDWDVAHISTGEKQRLGLARALVNAMIDATAPEVLLLDEPTSGLDEQNRDMAEKLILKQAQNGATILMVTHDRAQAVRMGAKILNINSGKISTSEVAP